MTQLRKYDYSSNWWPVATSSFSVTGDCTASALIPSSRQGVAFGLSTSASPQGEEGLEFGVKLTGAYLRVIAQGLVVAEVYFGTASADVSVSRAGTTYTITVNGSAIHTGVGSAARVWMAACLFDTGDELVGATLTGTRDAPGSATGSGVMSAFASRGSQGRRAASDGGLSRLVSSALSGTGVLHPVVASTLSRPTGAGHVAGWMGIDQIDVFTLAVTMDADIVPGVQVSSQVGVIATMSGQLVSNASMIDTVSILTALSTGETVGALMYSTLTADDGAEYAGAYSLTWAVNADTGASSMYEGYDLNSMGNWGPSQYLGARNDGIYLMEGDSDDGVPIRASIAFGAKTFGTLQKKTVQHAYLGVASGGGLYARVSVDGKTYTYKVRRSSDVLQTQRIDMGRGLQATHVVLELLNENGADFELADIEFNIAVLARRI